MPSLPPSRLRIKQVLIKSLNLEGMSPEMIEDDAPLWGEGFGLDSVDALELVVALEKEYGFRIEGEEIDQEALATIAHIERLVDRMLAVQPVSGGAER